MSTIRIFLDIDNSLYNSDVTGYEEYMRDLIRQQVQHYTGVTYSEASVISTDYYMKYGLTINGLIRHHGTRERPININEYCDFIHSCDYSKLHSQATDETGRPWLKDMLSSLQVTDGCDLWLLTNADRRHALRCTSELMISDLFEVKDEEKKKTRPYRLIDCFDQWDGVASLGYVIGDSPPATMALYNKPMSEAYARALKIAEDFSCTDGAVINNNNSVINIMVDDSLANLMAPAEMGWDTVWVSHGYTMPENHVCKPTFVIETVRELPRCVSEIKERMSRKNLK